MACFSLFIGFDGNKKETQRISQDFPFKHKPENRFQWQNRKRKRFLGYFSVGVDFLLSMQVTAFTVSFFIHTCTLKSLRTEKISLLTLSLTSNLSAPDRKQPHCQSLKMLQNRRHRLLSAVQIYYNGCSRQRWSVFILKHWKSQSAWV